MGSEATSKAIQPLKLNNAEEFCRTSAEPTVPFNNVSSTEEGSTTASRVAAMRGWEGGGVPSIQTKDVHDLLNQSKAVFVSLDLKTAGEEEGVVHLLAKMSRLDLVQHENDKGGACRGSVHWYHRWPGARQGAGRWCGAAPRIERWHVRVE